MEHCHARSVRQVLTPRSPQCAHHAQQGRILVVPDRRHAQSVLSDRHRQLAHRHAHPVRQGRTRVVLDRRHAQSVLSDRHRQ
jgi:hypothetical protein